MRQNSLLAKIVLKIARFIGFSVFSCFLVWAIILRKNDKNKEGRTKMELIDTNPPTNLTMASPPSPTLRERIYVLSPRVGALVEDCYLTKKKKLLKSIESPMNSAAKLPNLTGLSRDLRESAGDRPKSISR